MITTCTPGDSCCAPGCKYPEDTDCSKSCGDGVVDSPEICEPSSTAKPCPTVCDDSDPCTTDMLVGTAQQCNVMCVSIPVTTPVSGDRCCVMGANAMIDTDCPTKCGDGVVTGNETCDPMSSKPCATSCDDGDKCTTDMLLGSASTCTAKCTNTGTKESPERCDGQDNDCDGRFDEGVANACGGCSVLSAAKGAPCSSGQGACASAGTFECSGKEAVKCNAVAKPPTKEVCGDNIDNDCNGMRDECPAGQSCMSNGTAMVCSLPLPPGSYRNSCSGCVFDGITVTCAACDAGSGNGSRTSQRACFGGQSMVNCYGVLGCRDSASRVMQGTYALTCSSCFYDECQLRCETCEGMFGAPTEIRSFPCSAGVENCDGQLHCGPC